MSVSDVYKLSKAMKQKVCRGRDRYYMYFGCTPFIGGMSRGFSCGCNFRCKFCLSPFRDFLAGETCFILPSLYKEVIETRGFYSPEEVIERLVKNEKAKKMDEIAMFDGVEPRRSKFSYIDVGYAEITLGREHLLGLCEAASKTDYIFVVETNGFLLGYETDYAEALVPYKDRILVRVGVKAGSPEMFEKLVGVKGADDYVFKGISNLIKAGITPNVAMMCDPRIYPADEKELMRKKIRDAGYEGPIVEEKVHPYFPAYKRFVEGGLDPYILATNGKLEITGKRIKGTYFLERFNGESLLLPDYSLKAAKVGKFFTSMLSNFKPDKAKDCNAVIEFNIDGEDGGSWHFTIDKGKCTLEKGMTINPNVRFSMDVDTAYNCYITKKMDFAQAMFEGKLKVEGDHNFPFKIAEIFTPSFYS